MGRLGRDVAEEARRARERVRGRVDVVVLRLEVDALDASEGCVRLDQHLDGDIRDRLRLVGPLAVEPGAVRLAMGVELELRHQGPDERPQRLELRRAADRGDGARGDGLPDGRLVVGLAVGAQADAACPRVCGGVRAGLCRHGRDAADDHDGAVLDLGRRLVVRVDACLAVGDARETAREAAGARAAVVRGRGRERERADSDDLRAGTHPGVVRPRSRRSPASPPAIPTAPPVLLLELGARLRRRSARDRNRASGADELGVDVGLDGSVVRDPAEVLTDADEDRSTRAGGRRRRGAVADRRAEDAEWHAAGTGQPLSARSRLRRSESRSSGSGRPSRP